MFKDKSLDGGTVKGFAAIAAIAGAQAGGKWIVTDDSAIMEKFALGGMQPVGRVPDTGTVAMIHSPGSDGIYHPGSSREFDTEESLLEFIRRQSKHAGAKPQFSMGMDDSMGGEQAPASSGAREMTLRDDVEDGSRGVARAWGDGARLSFVGVQSVMNKLSPEERNKEFQLLFQANDIITKASLNKLNPMDRYRAYRKLKRDWTLEHPLTKEALIANVAARLATGWFIGHDGMWRKEEDDSGVKWDDVVLEESEYKKNDGRGVKSPSP